MPAAELAAAPTSAQSIQANHGHLRGAEYFPEADWTEQILSNPQVLECIADFASTEYRVPTADLNARTLKALYREQYVDFVTNRAPAMAKAGVSKVILYKLREIYKVRTMVTDHEIHQALVTVFAILAKSKRVDGAEWRLVFNGTDRWPLWKFFEKRLPGLGDRIAVEYRSADQYMGYHATTNAEQAAVNVKMFRGARAFMKAVDRGLTGEERQKIKDIILRNPLDDGIDDATRKLVDGYVAELLDMPKKTAADNKALVRRIREIWSSFGNEDLGVRKMYFFRQYTKEYPVPEHMFNQALEKQDYKPQDGDIVLTEGEDYFESLEDVAAKRVEMKDTLLSLVEQAHKTVVAGGDAKKIAESTKMKSAVDLLLDPSVQGDLEIMQLLESTNVTDRRLHEIADLFAPASDPASDELLLQALNPHPVAQKLWGARVQFLCQDHAEYTETYKEGNETIWKREGDWPMEKKPHLAALHLDEVSYPLARDLYYPSSQDEIFHMKLFRLADEFLDLNLGSDGGILAFENFVQTYDVSPGEATLERCFSSPPPAHTFAELPIIKFDGWEEADVVPEGVQIHSGAGHH